MKIEKTQEKTLDKFSCQVENYLGVLDYMCKDKKRSISLTRELKTELTTLFGKHNTTFKGEFYHYIWIVKYDNEIFNIYTAKDRGTDISINANYEENKSQVCISFLQELEKLLNTLN